VNSPVAVQTYECYFNPFLINAHDIIVALPDGNFSCFSS